MPWFELNDSDKRFYVDESDAPAVSKFRWRTYGGVPRTRGEHSIPIERVLGLPVLKGNMVRVFRNGDTLDYSRANYSTTRVAGEERFRETLGNIDSRIGVAPTRMNKYYKPEPRRRRP